MIVTRNKNKMVIELDIKTPDNAKVSSTGKTLILGYEVNKCPDTSIKTQVTVTIPNPEHIPTKQ